MTNKDKFKQRLQRIQKIDQLITEELDKQGIQVKIEILNSVREIMTYDSNRTTNNRSR